jgi:hypothetical protein
MSGFSIVNPSNPIKPILWPTSPLNLVVPWRSIRRCPGSLVGFDARLMGPVGLTIENPVRHRRSVTMSISHATCSCLCHSLDFASGSRAHRRISQSQRQVNRTKRRRLSYTNYVHSSYCRIVMYTSTPVDRFRARIFTYL